MLSQSYFLVCVDAIKPMNSNFTGKKTYLNNRPPQASRTRQQPEPKMAELAQEKDPGWLTKLSKKIQRKISEAHHIQGLRFLR